MSSIQPATPADAAAIARVHVERWQSTYAGIVPAPFLASLDVEQRTVLWQEWLASAPLVLTATSQQRVIGFVSGGAAREPAFGCDGELYAIYLLSDAQRQGIGSALFDSIRHALLAAGFRSMILWVLEPNPARSFYEAKGGKVTGSKPIEIGGMSLTEIAYTWPNLADPPQ